MSAPLTEAEIAVLRSVATGNDLSDDSDLLVARVSLTDKKLIVPGHGGYESSHRFVSTAGRVVLALLDQVTELREALASAERSVDEHNERHRAAYLAHLEELATVQRERDEALAALAHERSDGLPVLP